jgi:hypothetical protein
MVLNKLNKTITSSEFKPKSVLFRKNNRGHGIVDKNNYHLDRHTFLVSEEAGERHWKVKEGRRYIDGVESDISDKSRDVYEIFLDLSEEWKDSFLRIPNLDKRSDGFLKDLSKVPWNLEGVPDKLKLDKKWADRIHDTVIKGISVGAELLDDPEDEFGLLDDYWLNLKGVILNSETLIHFPMVLCEMSDSEEHTRPGISDDGFIKRIINSCGFNSTEKSYIVLSNMQRVEKVKASVDKGDLSKPMLDPDMRRKIAMRGVEAKTFFAKKKEKFEKKDKSLSKDFNTLDLESYLCTQFVIGEERDAAKEYDIDVRSNNVKFCADWLNLVSTIDEFKCLEFHDTVLAEVVANSTRNVDEGVFIVRKVRGYKAYVIIKPTSLGSVNDPKPIFYSIVFRGRSINTIFETVYDDSGGWSYTNFISTSRVRASHHMNSMPQFMMMIFENLETLSRLEEKVDGSSIIEISEPIKWCLISHLQDKEEYSSTVSDYRYYYFSLFSGFENCTTEAELLATKLPKVIRDPILLLATRRIIEIHRSLNSEVLSQETSLLSQKSMREDLENNPLGDSEYDRLPSVRTPFGFSIENSRTFLKASYMSIYHNKDEAERGPAAKQIVTKLAKHEHLMSSLLKSGEDPDKWDENIGKKLGVYEFNPIGCIFGADLLKRELILQSGLSKDSFQANEGFDDWIEQTVIIPKLLRTTYDALASTRSSYVDNGEIRVSKYRRLRSKMDESKRSDSDEEIPTVGETVKCLEAVIELRNRRILNGLSPSDDLLSVITEFSKNGSKLVIKIFKKNQLTGVREIYILTMVGRIMQRYVEDLARCIADRTHQEKLTGPQTKDAFIPEHKGSCAAMADGRESITVNGSGDKTQWANYLQAKTASLPLFRILPKRFHPLVAHVYNANTKKEIEIPSPLMESFLKFPDTDLEEEVLNEIKRAVLSGYESSIAKHDCSRLTINANTMQGIAHYSSTDLHMCALLLLKALIRKYIDQTGMDSYMSFEVSSDDKGFMVTVFLPKHEKVHKLRLILKLTAKIRHFERVIDSCFGIRDSRLKSVTSISVTFEFNSVFYFGNSITTPLAKFTSRCCDDSVQSTLHNRVSSMYSSVRQIRDNGGSGILCSLATMAQSIVMKNNLGFKLFSWFDQEAMLDYNKFKFSHLGYRQICNPITAGLCMSDFENIKVANSYNLSNQYKLLLRRDLDCEEMPSQISLATSMWKRDSHLAMLERLHMSQHEMTPQEALMMLSSPKTPSDMDMKLGLMATSGGLSRSFVQCQRSDLLRAGIYLLWQKAFTIDKEEMSFHSLIMYLNNMGFKEYKIGPDYTLYWDIEKRNRFYQIRSNRLKLMPKMYKPLISLSYVRDDVVAYLRNKWLGEENIIEEYLIKEINSECTWITETHTEFFDTHAPIMLHRLINMIPTIKTKTKLLSRGMASGNNMVECMMRDNTSATSNMMLTDRSNDSGEQERAQRYIRMASSRVSLWIDFIYSSYNDYGVQTIALNDMTRVSSGYEHGFLIYCNKFHSK